jgi:hypothetical protein
MLIPMSNAVSGTGVYAAWTLNTPPSSGAAVLSGTEFPDFELTSTNSTLSVAKSATLSGNTPFGENFGSSRGQQYLTSGVASGKPEGSVTLTFDSSAIPGTWGFVLGDVDAEDIKVSAKDAKGASVDVRGWQFTPFNYAGETDLPQWTRETERILGNGVDTSGASMWVTPTTPVASITLTQVKLSGFPQYQLWIAADVLTAADVQVAPAADTVCTRLDTNLINGDFEFPVLPAKSSSQIIQRDVPGWDTTATDGKIEIWSSGFKGVVAAEANQFAELNAAQPAELFQVVNTIPGETLRWSLMRRAHDAGAGGDTLSINIGAVGVKANSIYTLTDALPGRWVSHSGDYIVPAGQVKTRFGIASGVGASKNDKIGNFIDDVYFTTTECIPASLTEATPTMPDVSPSPSPSPSVSPSDSVSPSPSVSPSGSVSPSPSVSPSGSVSPSPSVSPSGSVSPSPSVSPSGSVSPSPSVSPSGSVSPSPSVSPTETPSQTLTDRTDAATPTTIAADDIPGVPQGSTITAVDPPKNGTAKVVDGTVIYTPKESFIGEEKISLVVLTPAGDTQDVVVTVAVGKEQKVVTRWTAPKKLKPGMNQFGPGTFMTNAGQIAKVSADCSIIRKWVSPNPSPTCEVLAGKEGTYIDVTVYEPTEVEVTLTAPKKGKYAPLEDTYTYRINP